MEINLFLPQKMNCNLAFNGQCLFTVGQQNIILWWDAETEACRQGAAAVASTAQRGSAGSGGSGLGGGGSVAGSGSGSAPGPSLGGRPVVVRQDSVKGIQTHPSSGTGRVGEDTLEMYPRYRYWKL